MNAPHDDLDALIQSAKQCPPQPPAGAAGQGWARLRGSLGAAVIVPHIDVPPGLVESAIAGKTVAASATTVVGWGQGLGWVGKAIASAVVTVTVGGIGVAGSGIVQRVASPVSQGVATSATSPGPKAAPAVMPSAPAELPTIAAAPTIEGPVVVAQDEPAPPTKRRADPRKVGAEAEAPMIAAALRLLNAGDASGALRELARHRRQHPHGGMTEDREALGVLALCEAGRTAAAAGARTKFLNDWPSSPHASRVRTSCTAR